jgi:hypothetical protein
VTDPESGAANGASEPVGSLAQETAKLLRALAAERMNLGHAVSEASTAPTSDHVCTTGWCPICQVVGYLHEHPELIEQLTETVTDAAVQIGRAVREVLDKTLPPER